MRKTLRHARKDWRPPGVKDSMSSDTMAGRSSEIKTRNERRLDYKRGERVVGKRGTKGDRKLKEEDKTRWNIHERGLISSHAPLPEMMGP